MNSNIPNFLYQKLLEQYDKKTVEKIVTGFVKKPVTFRVNTLKSTKEEIKNVLMTEKIIFEEVSYCDAFILPETSEKEIRNLSIYQEGKIYLQSLSSLLPAFILNPQKQENILDMAAAPGGKTTELAALSQDEAFILACEKNKIRYERLKYNIEKQGVKKTTVIHSDALKLDDYFTFDKILLDAPCSGSGTIVLDNNSTQIFSEELLNLSCKTQYQLLKKAISLLKPGHEMIYSTCSILRCENEEQIEKILKEEKVELLPITFEFQEELPLLPSTLKEILCICPNHLYEGFFIAKLRKK